MLLAVLPPAFPRLVDHHAHAKAADPSADMLMPASAHAQWSQFLPCATERNEVLHNFTAHHRSPWRSPPITSLGCLRHRCFRGVFDGRVQLSHAAVEARRTGTLATHNRSHGLHDAAAQQSYVEQMARVLAAEFGVDTAALSVSTRRLKAYESAEPSHLPNAGALQHGSEQNPCPGRFEQIHCDYYESANYVFTGVLYLGDEDADAQPRVGGETALVDAMRHGEGGECELSRGVVVEPKPARLLLFTSGGENYHAPLAVSRGRRTTYHVWWHCGNTPPRPRTRELQIEILTQGSGGATADTGSRVSVHYQGRLADGTVFDSSRREDGSVSPFSYTVGAGQGIRGWEQGIAGMQVGEVRRLTIPPALGYGEKGAGNVPPNATLIYDVELARIGRPYSP